MPATVRNAPTTASGVSRSPRNMAPSPRANIGDVDDSTVATTTFEYLSPATHIIELIAVSTLSTTSGAIMSRPAARNAGTPARAHGVSQRKIATIGSRIPCAVSGDRSCIAGFMRIADSAHSTATNSAAAMPTDCRLDGSPCPLRMPRMSTRPASVITVPVRGREDALEPLERLRAELDLGDRLQLLGFRDDVGAVLGAADAVAVPSTRPDPLPNSALEAAAAGMPVVGAAHGGIAEIVRDGETGLLVEPGDVGELAAALRSLADDRELRERLGARAADDARERFSRERMLADVQTLYAELLG